MTLATGGVVTDINVGGFIYRVHTFATSDDLVVTEGGQVEYLLVGGGGGAGGRVRGTGGGGAGGLLKGAATVSSGTALTRWPKSSAAGSSGRLVTRSRSIVSAARFSLGFRTKY